MNRPVTTASNLRRRQLCPGSERMEYGLPEEDSPQSKEGILLHDYDAHPEYDRTVLPANQRDLLDRNFNLKQTISERLHRLIGIHPITQMSEKTLDNGVISGTPDLVVIYPTETGAAWVNDSKFGYKIVERAELNLQLRVYAVLTYDWQEKKVERIFTSISQPRLPYEERITLSEYGREHIEESREQIHEILEAASKEDAPLHAGEEQCRYCKAKLICPEYNKTLTVPVLALKPQQDLSKTAREAYLKKRLSELDDTQLEQILVALSFANMLRSPATDEARKRIANGQLENYFLTKPKTERVIMDVQRAISLLTLAKVQTRDELMAMSSIPLGQVEESYRKRTNCTWKEAREKVDKVLANVIETKEEKPSVKRK